jgi:glyoxylase-like metal-dependent hydrolase (beta-lactamase superfamily II)
VRAVGLHADVVVITSRIWQTTCTLVRSGEEAFCVDSPVLPDELELLPAVAQQAGFGVVGLLATHGDWDHLLGRYCFPEAALGCAESTAERLQRAPGAVQRELRAFDEEHYVQRPSPLGLPSVQPLPTPGRCGIGEQDLQLHRAEGHTGDGMAIWIPWASVLVCGDYLSPVEIPSFGDAGSLSDYAATLERLEPLATDAEWVVPGHGEVLDVQRALAILREDRAYLEALSEHGAQAPLPLARRTSAQRRRHEANVARLGALEP